MPGGAAAVKKKKKKPTVAPALQVKKKLKPPTAGAGPTASKLAKYSPAGVVGAAVAKAAQKGQAQALGPNVGGGAMPAASYAQAAAAAQPYGTYLPTILKPGQQAPATPQIQYGGGAPGLKSRIAQQQIPGWYQPGYGAAGAGAGGGGGGGYAQAPPGVDPNWYKAFQDEHGGLTPEQFYEQTGEGLAEALRDREWSQMFAAQAGYAPTEYDWQLHWYQTRKGYVPSWMHPAPPGPAGAPAQEQRPPTYMPPEIIWR